MIKAVIQRIKNSCLFGHKWEETGEWDYTGTEEKCSKCGALRLVILPEAR